MTSLLFAGILMTADPGDRELVDRIAAVVNDDIITLSELKRAAEPYLAQNNSEDRKKLLYCDTVRQLIEEKLMTQQIKEADIDVSDEEVGKAVQDILRQNKITIEDLKAAIEARNMSMGQYKEDLKTQLIRLKLIDMKVRSRVTVPESEIRAEFDTRTKGQPKEEILQIRHVFFKYSDDNNPAVRKDALERSKAARARIVGGEAFEDVAKDVSEGPTAADGGDLGELNRKGLLPELEQALRDKEPGHLTVPIETSNGVHVVRLEKRELRAEVTYEQERGKIYQELYQREVEAQMKVWLQELRQNSAVDVRLDAKC